MKRNKQSGFTLVELSIVIVIIGFLIAGVAAGTNLIKQASLRSVISDMTGYVASYNNFYGRYNRVAGDMETANSYWGSTCAASATLCNGNNDALIQPAETNKAWNHLANAAMIANTSIQPVTSTTVTNLGTNAPTSRLAGAGYIMVNGLAGYPASVNAVFVGKPTATDTLTTGAMTAADAFAIDQKADDGGFNATPAPIGATTGSWRAIDGAGATAGDCAVAASGVYNLTGTNSTTTACRMGLALNS